MVIVVFANTPMFWRPAGISPNTCVVVRLNKRASSRVRAAGRATGNGGGTARARIVGNGGSCNDGSGSGLASGGGNICVVRCVDDGRTLSDGARGGGALGLVVTLRTPESSDGSAYVLGGGRVLVGLTLILRRFSHNMPQVKGACCGAACWEVDGAAQVC